MARTALTPVAVVGPFPVLPVVADSLDFAFTAGDNVNGNQFAYTGKEIILVQNTAGAPGTVTLTSIADSASNLRTGDVTAYSVGASEFCVIDPGKGDGWKQADGNFYLTCSAATIKFAILRLPTR